MSPVAEIRLIAGRELRRSVGSAKGIAVGILTLLGAFVTSLVCVKIEEKLRAGILSADALSEARHAIVLQATGDESLAGYLAPIPMSLLIFLKVTIWFSPLLVALFGFDAISGELQHREVRFWAVRSRRASYFVAKFLGLWALVGLVTLVLQVLAGAVVLARGYVTAGELAAWGGRLWLVTFAIVGPWAAIATLVSSTLKSPILALLTTFGAFFVSWILGFAGAIAHQRQADPGALGAAPPAPSPGMVWYEYFYPNSYDTLLLSGETVRVLTGVGLLALFMGIVTLAGAVVFRTRDV